MEELVRLLVEKTAEHIELMADKNADSIKLGDLKLQIENLRAIIAHRRSLNYRPCQKQGRFYLIGLVYTYVSTHQSKRT